MASHARPLYLHQEVLLLALRDEKGTIAASMYTYALGGAILAELMLRDRVAIVTEGRKTFASVARAEPIGEPVLDECLEKMAATKRRAQLQSLVSRFAGTRNLKHRVAGGLVDKGALRATEQSVLLVFSRRVYPQLDGRFEQAIIDRLRTAIFTDARAVDPRTVVLIALTNQSGILRANFPRKELKARKERLKAIVAGDVVGKATGQAIAAVQAAVTIAAVMPGIIAASTASSH
jgi:hypothetical protein